MISFYDYLNIGFYFLFIAGVGIYFYRRSKNTSDYFRGGGIMPWWVTGASAWMAVFTAWTFTGAAGKIYETGPYVLCLYYAHLPALLCILYFTCYRFRAGVIKQYQYWQRQVLVAVDGGEHFASTKVHCRAPRMCASTICSTSRRTQRGW